MHAAALKQVPRAEYNLLNISKPIFLVSNIIELLNNKVEKIIALSTDKAVSPVNLYGAKIALISYFYCKNIKEKK